MARLGVILALVAVAASASVEAKAETHELSAPSSVRVDILPDGVVATRTRNTQFVPFELYEDVDGKPAYRARLATVTASVGRRTDREGYDPNSTVSVAVDDLSGMAPKRLSSFSDPGAYGELVENLYFATTMPGCCGGADTHRVRLLASGRALFRSTGAGAVGCAAWAEAPNSRPRTLRWAAFDGQVSDEELKGGLVGRIAYGSDGGPLSLLALRVKPEREDIVELATELSHDAALFWLDPKHPEDDATPGSAYPKSIWAIEGVREPAKIGGFRLALRLEGRELALVAVEGDRLVLASAKTAEGFTLGELPR